MKLFNQNSVKLRSSYYFPISDIIIFLEKIKNHEVPYKNLFIIYYTNN